MTEKKKDDSAAPLAGMPKPAEKLAARRTETLFVAHSPTNGMDGFADVAVFGTKIGAYEFAFEQDPKWDVTALRKGGSLREAIA